MQSSRHNRYAGIVSLRVSNGIGQSSEARKGAQDKLAKELEDMEKDVASLGSEISGLIFPFFFTGGNREYRGKCAISLPVPSCSN